MLRCEFQDGAENCHGGVSVNIVVLDAMEKESGVTKVLSELLERNEETYSWLKLKDFKVLPCRSCGACGFKTPGRCVLEDDFETLIKEVVKSKVIILLTPIRFGGYPSELKKVMDRFMVLGLPLYVVKKGHLLHPMRYDIKSLFGIGISESSNLEQEESFKDLVENNALNMMLSFKALTFNAKEDSSKINHALALTIKEVLV